VKPDTRYTCEVCGARISPALGICPVCALQGALDHNLQTSELASNNRELPSLRFEHFEILTREDGTPFELGRGAMGVTYKAIDVNLRSAVALKVISPSYIADELAQQRFLREARAAASVRHANVASVFHLGRGEGAYFYAMEFVDGETLANLIRRSGGLGLDLALKITIQIATGLAAIHEQALVHRDIKPSNIMVVDERGEFQTAKIIDLGLAKAVNEPDSPDAISTPGVFAGTPEFASPEQFSGVGVDIRSDLYSLGVVLWEMVTGHAVFRGSPAEVMYKHLYTPLPLELLKGVPQPIVVLLGILLEKDPGLRFQSPSELLEAMQTITSTIDTGRPINPQSLRKLPDDRASLRREAMENLSANNLYVRGMAVIDLLDAEANQKAVEFFRKAIEQEPNFALGYVGLACFYLEQEGLHGEKPLLDSAVESARRAIALDPMEVRCYTTLARAYFRKGWYSQCDEGLQKALELGPNDDAANALAGLRALSRHQFAEAYHFFRKCYFLNPSETWRIYAATEILYRADISDLAEKWMQRALDQEAKPQLHHLMECYRMMWRRRFDTARAGFLQLPPKTQLAPKLQSTSYSASDGLLYCAIGLEDWPAVIDSCKAILQGGRDNIWARTYLALALQMSGRQAEAREMSEEILKRGLERLERPAQPDIPWDVPLYVAWAHRLIGRKDDAYHYLDQYLTNRTLLHMPLGLDNPILDVFNNDPEFDTILVDLKQNLRLLDDRFGNRKPLPVTPN